MIQIYNLISETLTQYFVSPQERLDLPPEEFTNNGSVPALEMKCDVEYYPLELYFEREAAFKSKMAEQRRQWDEERKQTRNLLKGESATALPEMPHEIASIFLR